MPIDPQALQTTFAPFVSRARRGLQTTLTKQTNLQRQGFNVGKGTREAIHGFGDILSQGFGQALASTEQQRQFDVNAAFKRQEIEREEDAATLSGIGSAIGIGGSILDIVYGDKSLMDIISGDATAGGAETPLGKVVSGGKALLGIGETATTFGEAAPSLGAQAVPSQASFEAVSGSSEYFGPEIIEPGYTPATTGGEYLGPEIVEPGYTPTVGGNPDPSLIVGAEYPGVPSLSATPALATGGNVLATTPAFSAGAGSGFAAEGVALSSAEAGASTAGLGAGGATLATVGGAVAGVYVGSVIQKAALESLGLSTAREDKKGLSAPNTIAVWEGTATSEGMAIFRAEIQRQTGEKLAPGEEKAWITKHGLMSSSRASLVSGRQLSAEGEYVETKLDKDFKSGQITLAEWTAGSTKADRELAHFKNILALGPEGARPGEYRKALKYFNRNVPKDIFTDPDSPAFGGFA